MSTEIVGEAIFIGQGGDRFGEDRSMGITSLRYKVAPEDTQGRVFIIEQTMHAKGGPARHLHLEQDEWFYAVQGDFVIEIGEARYTMSDGDSCFAPRQVPHAWAYVGEGIGRIVIAFTPAGMMEAFFNKTMQAKAMPAPDPELWLAHGMKLVGPPLAV
jgi:quercetin dioxygenase-like cupin family protein